MAFITLEFAQLLNFHVMSCLLGLYQDEFITDFYLAHSVVQGTELLDHKLKNCHYPLYYRMKTHGFYGCQDFCL